MSPIRLLAIGNACLLLLCLCLNWDVHRLKHIVELMEHQIIVNEANSAYKQQRLLLAESNTHARVQQLINDTSMAVEMMKGGKP